MWTYLEIFALCKRNMRDKENQFSPRAYWATFFNNSIILKQISNTVCDPTGKKKPFNIHPPAFTFSLPETVACFAACKSPNKWLISMDQMWMWSLIHFLLCTGPGSNQCSLTLSHKFYNYGEQSRSKLDYMDHKGLCHAFCWPMKKVAQRVWMGMVM